MPFERLEKMTARQVDRYYRIYEWQKTEEDIANEYLYPKPPIKPRDLPSPEKMYVLVKERIKEKSITPLEK